VSLSADNLAILERSLARARALVESDPSLREALPSPETFRGVIDCRTSIEIVQRAMATYGDRPAIGYRSYEIAADATTGRRTVRFLPAFETISYRALWERVVLLSSGLLHGGIAKPGDLVSLVGFSTVDHVVAELACHYLAAASVPFAKNVAARELEVIVNETASAALFCSVEQLLLAARTLQACPSVKTVVVIDLVAEDDAYRALVDEARAVLAASRPDVAVTAIADVEALGARAGRVPPVIPAPGTDPLLSLVYTSGSTGTPKGAMFTERSWHARWSTLPFLELAALPMVSVVFLPQNHMGGRNAVANSLKLGGLACLTHRSDMSTLFEDIRLVRPTYLHLVPRLSEQIYQHFQSEVARRGREGAAAGEEVAAEVMAEMRRGFLGERMLLALTASAPTPPEVSAFIKRCFDIPIVDVFAGTEYGQLLVDGRVNRHNVLTIELVSVPELGYTTSDEPYPRGELYVKTARGISSYFRNEAATRELFDAAGFMRTGDIFEWRGPDELVWIDRKNNVQKLAQGEFVNIWKLEALFATGSRLIKQVYIQGQSARSYLLAVIVPEAAEVQADGEAAIKRILRAELHRLASAHGLQPYEVPRDFVVEPEPFSRENGLLTSLGKPSRPRLKARYGAAIDGMYEQLERRASAGASAEAQDAALPVVVRVRRTIAAILGLGLDESALDEARSFRSLGGDSIAAANLCAAVQREHGVRLSVGFVLGPETAIAELCGEIEARLDRRDAMAEATTTFERIHGPSTDAIRARDLRLERFLGEGIAPRPAELPSHAEARAFLLTGATGFLGRFLCLELLERAARTAGTVYCIVRARSDADAAHRLAEVYRPGSALHERFAALARGHLRVLAGDLEQPRLGLPVEQYRRISDDADAVVHAAALVNHALPYAQLFDANVLGTASVMRLALEGRPKRFSYTSTNSVSLALLGDRELALETDDTRALGDGWPAAAARHANGYQLSKWAGEVLAQDLAETFGIPVNVFRCNLILPPAHARGQLNADDFLARLVCSVAATGLYPGSFYERGAGASPPHLDGFPVDFMAAAIAAIAADPSRGYAVYHVNNVHWDDGISLDTVIRRLAAAGYPLTRVDDYAAWFQRFEHALRELPAALQAASSLPILDQWRTPLSMARRRRIDASRFRAQVQSLRPQGQGDLPRLDDAYFDRCIEDLRALGLLSELHRS
jgi:fatty acid CoA ligase FadD9